MSKTFFVRAEVGTNDGDLMAGLAARVHDPLWLLGRQWQMGELLGDDAGRPVSVEMSAEAAMLSRFSAPGSPSQPYDPRAMPIDVLTAEPSGVSTWTVRRRIDAGREFVAALADHGAGDLAPAFRGQFALAALAPGVLARDPQAAALLSVCGERIPDGGAIFEAYAAALRNGDPLPQPPVIDPAAADAVRAAAAAWLAWCEATLTDTGADTWLPDRLTHGLTLSTGSSAGSTAIDLDRWRGERLDWHTFDVRPNAPATDFRPLPRQVTIPTGVRFRGMPAARWWEMEDASVDFGAVDAGPSDVARLAVLEFALCYANDFFVVPLGLAVGSLCRISSLVVRDTFGMAQEIHSAVAVSGRQGARRWSMFTMTERDPVSGAGAGASDVFFLPSTAAQLITMAPLEEVVLLRDEMANMAWAVEQRIEGPSGNACARIEETTRTQPAPPSVSGAALRYQLGTTVPMHWYPLTRVAAGDLRLQLSRMRDRDAAADPGGRILRIGGPPIADAEIPREGVKLTREYALTRWTNGATFAWSRRLRGIGRGEGTSGLAFDTTLSR